VWDEGQSAAKNHAFPPPPAAACAFGLRIFSAVGGLWSLIEAEILAHFISVCAKQHSLLLGSQLQHSRGHTNPTSIKHLEGLFTTELLPYLACQRQVMSAELLL
jgi:hypothetical protein